MLLMIIEREVLCVRLTYTKRELLDVIDDVFRKEKTLKAKLNKEEFKAIYFDKILNRLKISRFRYSFDRREYQTRVRLYFYYSQEKNIYIILALAMMEARLFDE